MPLLELELVLAEVSLEEESLLDVVADASEAESELVLEEDEPEALPRVSFSPG
jgi:hypothetical protein